MINVKQIIGIKHLLIISAFQISIHIVKILWHIALLHLMINIIVSVNAQIIKYII